MSKSKHTPAPWGWEYHPDFPDKVMALSAGKTDVLICTGTETAAFGIIGEADARLIERSPSMLALLQKALPIIEAEAARRGDWGERHNAAEHQYATEMRELADEIEREIAEAGGEAQ